MPELLNSGNATIGDSDNIDTCIGSDVDSQAVPRQIRIHWCLRKSHIVAVNL